MSPAQTRRSTTRTVAVLFQIVVFVSSIFGPISVLAVDPPLPDPIPSETPSEPPASVPPASEPPASESPATEPPVSEPPASEPPAEPAPEPTPDGSESPAASPEATPPAEPTPDGTVPYIVSFGAGTDEAGQASIAAAAGVTDVAAIPQLSLRSVLLHEELLSEELDALRADPSVTGIYLDRTRAAEAAPSDPSFADQWALEQIGWSELFGTVSIAGSATVAVLDTGVDASHPDLDGVVLSGTSVLDGSDGRSDPNGHGTWMAGIAAAETDNGLGVAGTAYAGVSVLPVTVLGADGLGQDSDIIAGVVYAADAGADVILMAFSNPGFSPALQAAIDYAWARGAVLVAAVGNDASSSATYPAGDRGVIGVAATDSSDALSASSNYGDATFLAAPGVDIATTAAGSTSSISGTSASAAMVAGAAALLRANEPPLSNGAIVGRLARNADPTLSEGTGNGRLNLARAMADASTEEIQPAGVAPLGEGGPLVGPYVAGAPSAFIGNPAGTQTAVTSTAGAASLTINKPAGATYGMLMVAHIAVDGGSGTTITAPAGWEPIDRQDNGVLVGHGLYYRIVDFSTVEPASHTWTFSPSVRASGAIATYAGVDAANPIAAVGIPNANASNNNSAVALGVSVTGVRGGTNIAFYTSDSDTTHGTAQNVTGSPNMAERYDVSQPGGPSANSPTGSGNDGPLVSSSSFSGPPPFTGTTPNRTSALGTSTRWLAQQIVINGDMQTATWNAIDGSGGLIIATPPAAAVGDFLIAQITYEGGTNVSTINAPSGWELLRRDDSGSNVGSAIYYKFLEATDPATHTWTFVGGGSKKSGGIMSYSGIHPTDPIDDHVGTGPNTSNSATSNLQVTTEHVDARLVFFVGIKGQRSATPPANMKERYEAHPNNLPTSSGSDTVQAAIGPSGNKSATWTGGSETWTAQLVALRIGAAAPVNDPPVVDAGGDYTGTEGTDVALDGAATDPDGDELTLLWAYTADVADGGTTCAFSDDAILAPTFSCTDDGTFTVTLSADDGVNDPVTDSATVTLANADPLVNIDDPDEDELFGTADSVSVSASFTDAGANDTHTCSIDWGDGSLAEAGVVDQNTDTCTDAAGHTYASGTWTITVTVTDDDTGDDDDTVSIIVNDPPVVDAGGDYTGTEGTDVALDGAATDPDGDELTLLWAYTADVADGGTTCAFSDDAILAPTFSCTDDGTFTVTLSADDGVNDPVTDSATVTLANADPLVNIDDPDEDELFGTADSVSVSASFTDAGANDTHTCSIDWGDGSLAEAGVVDQNTDTCTDAAGHTYASGTWTITVTVTDDDTGDDDDTVSIIVNDPPVAGAIALSDSSPATNDLLTATSTLTDPDLDLITSEWVWTVTRGSYGCVVQVTTEAAVASGTAVQDSLLLSTTFVPVECDPAAGAPASINPSKGDVITVELTPEDPHQTGATVSAVATVANTAPSVTFGPANTANEGTATSFSFGASDDDGDELSFVSASCGSADPPTDSDFDSMSGLGYVTCTFPDGPATDTVSVTISDGDTSTIATKDVEVANVAPTVELTGADAAFEGDTETYTYTVSDPGADTLVITEDCGTGATYTDTPAVNSFDCTFPDGPATYTVSVTANDGDPEDNIGSDSIDVEVANVAPTVELTGADAAFEGDTETYTYTVSDPGADTLVITEDCGTGATYTDTPAVNSFDCTFPDGPATYTVSVTANDGDPEDNIGSDSIDVEVANVAPTVELTGADAAFEGDTETYTYTVSDPGADTLVITEDCGTGATYTDTPAVNSFDCTFPDGPATYTVSVTANDGDPEDNIGSDSIDVEVANVAPTVELTGADAAFEGDTETYTYTVSDPGADTLVITEDCGTGATYTDTPAVNSFDCTFPDGPATYTVSVTANDGDPEDNIGSDSIDVEVANVAPTVELTGADAAFEGDTETYTYTVSDPGADTLVITEDCGTGATYTDTPAVNSFDCTFPDGPATYTVSVTANDGDPEDNIGSDSIDVEVANVAPTVELTGADAAFEGDTETYTYTVSDPGADTLVITEDCGTGATYTDTPAVNSFDCTFPDGPATYTVSVTANDGDPEDNIGSDSIDVEVANVAPTVELTGADAAFEGDTETYTYTVSDPGADTLVITEDCGTGATYTDTPAVNSFDCTFPDGPATYTVSVTANDGDPEDNIGSDSIDVEVANVAPTVELTGADAAFEGDTETYTYTVSDPGADTLVITEDCGTGATYTDTPAVNSFDCTFPDGPATYTVSVTANDGDPEDNIGSDSIDVEVANVAPTVELTGADAAFEGDTETYTYTVSDPGADTLVITEDCGTGATYTDTPAVNSFDCTFPDGPATYTVSVTANDGDPEDNIGSDSIDVEVANVAPTVELTGADAAFEGDTETYTYTVSDPGADTLVITEDCGTGATYTDTPAVNSFDCTFPDGPATYTVSVTANDGDPEDNIGSDSIDVEVANVAPTNISSDAVINPVAGTVVSEITFSDPGADTETAKFRYSWTGTSTGDVTNTAHVEANSGTAMDTFQLDPGCYTIEVRIWVTDSDGADSAVYYESSGSGTDFVNAEFRPPIKEDMRNIAKYGNVVPVKVELMSMCFAGTTVTSANLHITIVQGDQTNNDAAPDNPLLFPAESVSNADNGDQMRIGGGGYIYNLTTRKFDPGQQEYTIRIRVGANNGPIILRALFQLK